MSKSLTLQQAVGQQLRQIRLDHGLRQDDVAAAARDVGLDWRQSTVAAIEGGARAVSLEEFLLLPQMVFRATGAQAYPNLADLLPASGRVALTDQTSADLAVLRVELAGQGTDDNRHPFADFDTPVGRKIKAGMAEFTQQLRGLTKLWPGITMNGFRIAKRDAGSGAERKAAHKLGVPALELSAAAHGRYGRSFTAERDARVAEQAPADAPPRSLQALRGHVTRAMLAELAPVLERKEG